MSRRTLFTWLGVGLLLVGGGALAFAPEHVGTPVGTTCGLAGVACLLWSWLGGDGGQG